MAKLGNAEATATPQAASATAASTFYARLRSDIVTGTLPSGKKLRLAEVCRSYEVGSSPAREAMNRLAAEGLLVQTDRRGFAVPVISREDLVDLTQARCWVAEVALREAIRCGDDRWEEGVVLALHRLDRLSADHESTVPESKIRLESAHRAFHSALLGACPSKRLLLYSEQLFDLANRYRSLARALNAVLNKRDRTQEHHEIARLTLARDSSGACALLTQHFQTTCDIALAYWDELYGHIDPARKSVDPGPKSTAETV
ncbi:MAG TPA: GntR family transcriptional regulator [Burkholderiales bacterium]